MENKLVIIDGNSIFYRSFYALPLLSNAKGEYSNAIYGFAIELLKVITEMKPKYIAVAFDVSKKTFRNDIYADYKATRKPMPEELASQINSLKRMLSLMGIKMLEKQGLEADDIIGTIAKRFDVDTLVLTGDRDSFQLIDKSTKVCFMKKGLSEVVILGKDNLKEFYGVEPEQVVDLKALQGDTADNIPGVMGVGPKTAVDLITKYKTLDGVYDHIEEVQGKLKEKLISGKEMAYISKKLATINTKVDIECELSECEYVFPFGEDVKTFFEEYSFRSLLKRAEIFSNGAMQETMNCDNLEVVEAKQKITIENELEKVLSEKFDKLAIYINENFNFSFNGKEYEILLKNDLISDGIALDRIFEIFKSVLENDKITKIYFDAKSMFYKFNQNKIKLNHNFFDVSIALNLCRGIAVKKVQDVLNVFDKNDKNICLALIDCCNSLSEEIKNKNLQKAYYEIEIPLIFTLFNMELRGFKVDRQKLMELKQQYNQSIKYLEERIHVVVGHSFNINSPKQLGEVLFDELKLPKISKDSTNSEVLEKLMGQHEVIPLLIEYRKDMKFYGTYLAGMEDYVDENGFVHTNFNQTLTATGRLSSSEPNLQNIPIRDEEGRTVRSIFTASSKDNVLVDADYSQIELRILAHFSNDEFYINAFKNNEDIHTKTACSVFGLPAELITSRMRRIAKVVNFGVVYGISQYGLAQELNIAPKEAKGYIDGFYKLHPNIEKYMDDQIKFAKDNGFVKTMFGRVRELKDINVKNFMVRNRAERMAQNMAIQGTAAEIIKIAMNKVEKSLTEKGLKAKLIMQVHDELVVDCPKNEVNEVRKILKNEMENAVKLSVPLNVDISEAFRWGDAH